MTTPRDALADAIEEIAPKPWRIITSDTNLDAFQHPVVILKQQRFQPAPAAPNAYHIVDFVITIASPLIDPVKAENQLDAHVDELIHDIDAAGILWSTAEKVQYADRYLAYDITVHLESRKE